MADMNKQPTSKSIIAQKQVSQYARSLIEARLDPLVTISPEGRTTDVNEGSIKVSGTLCEEMIGTDFFNYLTEPEACEGCQEVFAKGFVTESRRARKDGSRFTILIDVSHGSDASGKTIWQSAPEQRERIKEQV